MSELLELLKSALSGAWGSNVGPIEVVLALFLSTLVAVYIHLVYSLVIKRSFYSKEYAITLVGVCLITTVLVITIQFSLLVSLSVGGALSIVRFRTAIKSSLDMMFLFWSIAAGIMCGTGVSLYAFIMSLALTLVVLVFMKLPLVNASQILIVNAKGPEHEKEMTEMIASFSRNYTIKSRNLTRNSADYTIELRSDRGGELIDQLVRQDFIESASLLSHNGDVNY